MLPALVVGNHHKSIETLDLQNLADYSLLLTATLNSCRRSLSIDDTAKGLELEKRLAEKD